MNNKKIIFMGSPKIASDYLEALIKSNFIISAVFSQPPKKKSRGMKIIESEVHQLANKNNIEVFSIDWRNWERAASARYRPPRGRALAGGARRQAQQVTHRPLLRDERFGRGGIESIGLSNARNHQNSVRMRSEFVENPESRRVLNAL